MGSGTYYIVTYEWRKLYDAPSLREWRRENSVITGCPGVWWADMENRRRREHEARRKVYAARGLDVIPINAVTKLERRFLYATPICAYGYESLINANLETTASSQ
jgi:hypothetical protein